MTVNPGFGGQAFIPAVVDKVRRVRRMIGARDIRIEIDGGIAPATAPLVVERGRGRARRRLGRVQGRAFGLRREHRGDPRPCHERKPRSMNATDFAPKSLSSSIEAGKARSHGGHRE